VIGAVLSLYSGRLIIATPAFDCKHQCCVRCNVVSDLRAAGLPGAAHLMLAAGVAHLDPSSAMFEAMLEGWATHEPVPVAVGAGGG
jgi:hypothetical protein